MKIRIRRPNLNVAASSPTKSAVIIPDGTLLGIPSSPGEVFQVFAPKWWRVGRWLWWFWNRLRGRLSCGTVVFRLPTEDGIGEARVMRVLGTKMRNPRVPGPEAKRLAE